MRRLGIVAATALAVAAASCGGASDRTTAVKGVQFERTTSTAAAEAITATTASPTAAPPRLATETTVAVGVAASPTPTTTTVPARRTVVERSDNGGYFAYDPGGPNPGAHGSAMQYGREADPFRFSVIVGPADGEGRAPISGSVKNEGSAPVRFPGGFTVRVTITRADGDGAPIVVEVRRPETELAPGGELPIEGEVRVTEPGQYNYVAETTVEHDA